MLATTAYDNPDASYTYSIQASRSALHAAGFGSMYLLMSGNCHVDDSRNAVVREFLETDCTDLIFLDADVSWEPESLVTLCQFGIGDSDIVGGVYPFRRNGANGAPVIELDQASGEVSLVREAGLGQEEMDGLALVAGLPTGFMRIAGGLLRRMARETLSFQDKNGDCLPLLFERTISGGGRLGGDINFCLKARRLGARVWAATEIRLGHATKHVRFGSYGSAKRLEAGETLKHVAAKIRNGGFTLSLMQEAIEYVDNHFSAREDVLMTAIGLARKAEAPILELGSGLTTVLMAAASKETVIALEHSSFHATLTRLWLEQAGIENAIVLETPLVDGFYDTTRVPSGPWSFLLVDGPPRHLGKRELFASRLGDIPKTVLFDDAVSSAFRKWASDWADGTGRRIVDLPAERMMLMMEKPHEDAG